ncbi:LTA synthase family protein [Collinsella tanakaei]|uniref:LTA synthase family protein n=1 Tax=Collinsella tanakaei TaxID=626935 RepID=UPI001957411C|nr:LTA synthase family protein [Collinsella tanakaei]MBM6756503.1 LTA synthase family protein [Collinsella tanakaei]
MTDILPSTFVIIPLAAAIGLVVLTVASALRTRTYGRRLAAGDILWPAAHIALLAVMAYLCHAGMCIFEPGALVIFSLVVEAAGALTLARSAIAGVLDRMDPASGRILRPVRDVALMTAASVLSVWALERAWNAQYARIPILFFGVAVLVVLLAMLALYFAGQRTGALCTLAVAVCGGFGVAQYFIQQFKSAAILPSDLLALQTAAAVSGGYTYQIDRAVAESLIAVAVALTCLSFIQPAPAPERWRRATRVGVNLCCAGAVAAAMAFGFTTVNFEEALDFTYDRWWPIATYSSCGFIPSFIAVAQDLPIPEPDDYTDEQADEAEDALVAAYDATLGQNPSRIAAEQQFAEVKPAIITIMNESFSDLSVYDGLREAGYTGPAYYNSLSDTLQRGCLMASTNGGGTANSEFEYLTGNSIAFVGNGKYPYQLYNLSNIDSLPKQLAALGYRSRAVHPQSPTNWNRSMVYPQLGFEDFISNDDFDEDAPHYHSGVTDRVTYDKVLEHLREDDGPQFIFDVTMQNHSGYDAGTVPEDELMGFAPAGVTDANLLTQLNTYLTCIEASDRDLTYLIDQLRTIGRPVVLVFFGDHQPNMTTALNDVLYPGEDNLSHQWRLFESTYFVWANYDVAGNDQMSFNQELSINELAAQMLYMIGAPLTDYQKALLASRSEITSISANGYRGADGLCYELDANSPYRSLVDELRTIQYRNFARKIR